MKLQIWVMWSAADLGYSLDIQELAFQIWKCVAKNNMVLVFWAEKDTDSLSTSAARWAKSEWWIVMWVTYWKESDIWWDTKQYVDTLVCTWMERGWGREYILVSSCDALVVIGWWSGTLNEVTIAYQKKIPVFVMDWTGWWADKLSWTYLDERYKTDSSRFKCEWINSLKQLDEKLKWVKHK